ncbi:6713_t:CDS:10, partial [Scutellospora calospora]
NMDGNTSTSGYKVILGILLGAGYNINSIMGAGIFNPDSIWLLVQSAGIALILYVVCGIISLLGSLIYIELGIRSLPKGMGEQTYINDAFPNQINLGHLILMCPPSTFSTFFEEMLTTLTKTTCVTLIKIIALVIISIIGLVKLETNSIIWSGIFDSRPQSPGAYFNGILKVLFTYEDFIGELSDPKEKKLIYSSLISVGVSFLLYFFTTAAFITVVGYDISNNVSIPIALRFGNKLFGETGEQLMAGLIVISAFGSVATTVFVYGRIIKYAASTRFIPWRPDLFNIYDKTFNTPTNALLAQFIYCLVLTIIFSLIGGNDPFDFFSSSSQYLAMMFHGASAISLLILKYKVRFDGFTIYKHIVGIYLLIIVLIIILSLFPPEPEYHNFNYLIPYAISWGAALLGVIIWRFRKPREGLNDTTEQNSESEYMEGFKESIIIN